MRASLPRLVWRTAKLQVRHKTETGQLLAIERKTKKEQNILHVNTRSRVVVPELWRGTQNHLETEDAMNSKTRIMPLLTLMLLAAVPGVHAAVCSNATIAGRWAFTSNGMLTLPTGSVPVAGVGQFTIDASGNISGSQTRSLGGQVAEETFTGTLPLNEDCSGEEAVQVYINGVLVRTTTLHVVFDDHSRSARGIFTSLVLPNETSLPNVITVDARRLFPRN